MIFHQPVMVLEAMQILNIKEDGIYLDATLGYGGHTCHILKSLKKGFVIAIDKDDDAINYCKKLFSNASVVICKGSFSDIKLILADKNIKGIDGALFDFGVSMCQLTDLSRGFSFLSNEMLDMRMDKSQTLNAWTVVNKYKEKDLDKIIFQYGDEKKSKKIASAIVKTRQHKSIDTCSQLASIISDVYGDRGKLHPATKTFQALRIEVNNELNEISQGLLQAFDALNINGRICTISYHSLEDRIVKHFIRDITANKQAELITKKPLLPSSQEIKLNKASRSAKMRGVKKVLNLHANPVGTERHENQLASESIFV